MKGRKDPTFETAGQLGGSNRERQSNGAGNRHSIQMPSVFSGGSTLLRRSGGVEDLRRMEMV